MPLQHTPLAPGSLSPEVARATSADAPLPARMMAAEGLLPLRPVDLAVALYQLSLDPDPKVAEAARAKAATLPPRVLCAALETPLDERVLDFFAGQAAEQEAVVERILLNRNTSDETFLALAGKLGGRPLEVLAGNQQRLLRCPAIIEALYLNSRAMMSTVQRLLEMAVRNGLTLSGIPHFKELAVSILGGAAARLPEEEPQPLQLVLSGESMDSVFTGVLEEVAQEGGEDWEDAAWDGQASSDQREASSPNLKLLHLLPVSAKIRLATIGPTQARSVLIKDPNRMVALAAVSAPGVSEVEAARLAASRALHEEVIRFIANKKEWHKNYQVKVNLVNNPKCPLATAMRFLSHLRPHDLRAVATSKNVPSVLCTVARRMLQSRKS